MVLLGCVAQLRLLAIGLLLLLILSDDGLELFGEVKVIKIFWPKSPDIREHNSLSESKNLCVFPSPTKLIIAIALTLLCGEHRSRVKCNQEREG